MAPVWPSVSRALSCIILLSTIPDHVLAQNSTNSTQSCAKCDEVAHGFASLNGGTSGGKGGRVVTAKTHTELKTYAAAKEPLIIRIDGMLQSDPVGYEVPISSNKTVIGVGAKSGIFGGGLAIKNQKNVIVRNIEITGTYDPNDYPGKEDDFDALQVDNSTNIWVDYVKFHAMRDGLIDLRTDSDYITVSRSILSEHNKAFGIGWTPNVIAKVTINDMFFNSTNTRNPSADNVLYGHLYNNYYRNITQYGNYARGNASLLIENSYFEDVFDPIVSHPTNASIKTNWVKFKNCKGETHLNVRPEKVFDASKMYKYSLRDPYDIPIDIPYFSGPRAEIGI